MSASNCSLCSPGYGEVTPCTGDTDTQCAQCNTGFFSRNSSHSPCQQCSSCHDDEFEVERCTPTSDTVCQKCSSCDPGFGVIEPCGQSTDTVCGLCPLSTDVRYPLDKCLPCTGCLVKDDQDPLAEFQDSDKEIERRKFKSYNHPLADLDQPKLTGIFVFPLIFLPLQNRAAGQSCTVGWNFQGLNQVLEHCIPTDGAPSYP